METNIYGLPAPEIEAICNYDINYSLMIAVNLILSLAVYVGYIIVRWKFREKQETYLFYVFMLAGLMFSLNIFFFITQFGPNNGILEIGRKTI